MPADPPGTTPNARDLVALGSDVWASLLRAVRRVIASPPSSRDRTLDAFRQAPTSRLVGGPLQGALAQRLADDAALWGAVTALLGTDSDGEDVLAALGGVASGEVEAGGGSVEVGGGSVEAGGAREGAAAAAKQRIREARAERDLWRRRAEGATARADRLSTDFDRLASELVDLRGRLESADAVIASARVERAKAVDRERRRRDGEVAALADEVARLRSEEEQRRSDARRRVEQNRLARVEAERASAAAQVRAAEADRPSRIVVGRPSRLPRGVEPGTTEAARELLHRNRLLLVDGYNVTKQHRGRLDLETQRSWLVQQLGLLARQRGVRPVVVFDGQESGGGRPSIALRDVEVRFTPAGITADDELVLAVEGTDDPVVVVTDDRELIARVTVSGADVVGTRSFLGVLA